MSVQCVQELCLSIANTRANEFIKKERLVCLMP